MEPVFKIGGDIFEDDDEDLTCTEIRTTALMYFDGMSETEVCRAESSTTLSSEFDEVALSSCCPESYDQGIAPQMFCDREERLLEGGSYSYDQETDICTRTGTVQVFVLGHEGMVVQELPE